jgi:uncharacterized protein
MSEKPTPVPTPETQPYWDGAASGELRIQRCRDCGRAYFYPRAVCPHCGSTNVEWFAASGSATLHSYIINERATSGYDPPFVIAIVELEEGPRMLTNIIDVEPTPNALVLDMPLTVRFEQRADMWLPMFAPAERA